MTKKSRRAERRELERKQQKNEMRAADRNKHMLEQAVKFIDKSFSDPEWYDITCNRIMTMRCTCVMIDSLLYDINEFVGFADIDPSTRKSLSKITKQIDGMLDHLLHDSIMRFGERNKSAGKSEDDEYDGVSKMAFGMQKLCELYLMWFVDTEWRQVELDKFMKRMIPEDVVKERNKKTLEELHKHYDETRETIAKAIGYEQ